MTKFEDTEDDKYLIHKDENASLFVFKIDIGLRFRGRLIEITDTALTISDLYKMPKKDQKGFSLKFYQDGDWRKGAKSYDRALISGVRVITEKIGTANKHYYIVVLDYGNKIIHVNDQHAGFLSTRWGVTDELTATNLHTGLHRALTVQHPYRPEKPVSKDQFDKGVNDLVDLVLEDKKPSPKKDPFG